MQRWKITIEYNGEEYCGWQRQIDEKSVQEEIEKAICKLALEKSEIYGSGRTDRGVHAYGQVAHFDLQKDLDDKAIRDGINHHLHKNKISIISAEKVGDDFHARFSAKQRTYCYKIISKRRANPILSDGLAWHVGFDLNIDDMNKAAKYLIGRHDFSSFRASACQSKSPIKSIDDINVMHVPNKMEQGEHIEIWVSATSFMHHQVRNITGSLVDVGKEKITVSEFKEIFEGKDRTKAGVTAPAHGLYFIKVSY